MCYTGRGVKNSTMTYYDESDAQQAAKVKTARRSSLHIAFTQTLLPRRITKYTILFDEELIKRTHTHTIFPNYILTFYFGRLGVMTLSFLCRLDGKATTSNDI